MIGGEVFSEKLGKLQSGYCGMKDVAGLIAYLADYIEGLEKEVEGLKKNG